MGIFAGRPEGCGRDVTKGQDPHFQTHRRRKFCVLIERKSCKLSHIYLSHLIYMYILLFFILLTVCSHQIIPRPAILSQPRARPKPTARDTPSVEVLRVTYDPTRHALPQTFYSLRRTAMLMEQAKKKQELASVHASVKAAAAEADAMSRQPPLD